MTKDDYVYVEYWKGIYGLPQADILAQQLLEKGQHSMAIHRAKSHLVFGLTLGDPSAPPCLTTTLASITLVINMQHT